MKKLLKISAVTLAVGVILSLVGVFIARRDDVNPGSIYAIVESNLKISESIVELEAPKAAELSSVTRNSLKNATYGLNEFNTLELYAENADVRFAGTDNETIRVSLDNGSLTTAIKEGTLYIQAVCEESSDGQLTVEIPEIYKGACVINAAASALDLGSIESAMDMIFSLDASSLEAGELKADNITVMLNASTIGADSMIASDSLKLFACASELKTQSLSSKYTALEADNSTVTLPSLSCGFSCECRMSTLELSFTEVTGNISLDTTAGSAVVKLPKDAPIELRHSEEYGILTNKTNHAQNDAANSSFHYTMETNIKFGIVTLEELR